MKKIIMVPFLLLVCNVTKASTHPKYYIAHVYILCLLYGFVALFPSDDFDSVNLCVSVLGADTYKYIHTHGDTHTRAHTIASPKWLVLNSITRLQSCTMFRILHSNCHIYTVSQPPAIAAPTTAPTQMWTGDRIECMTMCISRFRGMHAVVGNLRDSLFRWTANASHYPIFILKTVKFSTCT